MPSTNSHQDEAMLSCYQMFVNGQWVRTYCGHTGIKHSLTAHAPLPQMRSNKTLPQYISVSYTHLTLPTNREV